MTPQSHKVIDLLQHHPLDYLQAKTFGIQRLSARISECRAAGQKIGQTRIYGVQPSGKKIVYSEYFLKTKKEPPGKKPREEETLTLCKCPLCRDTHEQYMWWTGRGMPWKYCKKCLAIVNGQNCYKSHG